MKARHFCVALAAVLGGAIGLLIGPTTSADGPLADAGPGQVIPQIPEHSFPSGQPEMAVDDLDRCIALGDCTLVDSVVIGTAQVDVVQQEPEVGELPSLHFKTVVSDSTASVWTLASEHGGTYLDLICGLTNCVLTVDVSNEMTVIVDMRIVSNQLRGAIEGAAFTSSTNVYVLDLNDDAILDAVVAEHGIGLAPSQPFYRTVLNDRGVMVTTGCSQPGETGALPNQPLSRTCPAY